MKTIELNEGDGAVVLSANGDGGYKISSLIHFGKIDAENVDEVTDALYLTALTRGMAYLVATDSDLVAEAGYEYLRNEALNAQA